MLLRVACVFACVIVVFTAACSALVPQTTENRSFSAAADASEVRDAWNIICFSCNFFQCPVEALNSNCPIEMGDLYYGSDFEADCDALLKGIAFEVDSVSPQLPQEDEVLNSLLENPSWQISP